MDFIRFIGLYIIFVCFLLSEIYYTFNLLTKKNRDILSYNIALFYIINIICPIGNIIYSMIFDPFIVLIFYKILILIYLISFFFIFNFNLILLKTKFFIM